MYVGGHYRGDRTTHGIAFNGVEASPSDLPVRERVGAVGVLRLVRRNGKDHPWDCLERSCSSPADLLCTREGRRGSCAASDEEERRGALPTTDDVDLGDAGIRGALARGG